MKKKPKYAPSIMQSEKRCYLEDCNCSYGNLHHHEIFFGSKDRDASIENGCWVWLCFNHHRQVHDNGDVNKQLKRECQKVFEDLYGHDKFLEKFSKGYL